MASKRILVVEDFRTQRLLIVSALEKLSFQTDILEAENGKEAVEVLKKNKVDLVISDFEMPDMNGLELVREIRSDQSYNDVSILMISSRDDKEREILNAGASKFIHKPFDKENVQSAVMRLISGGAEKQYKEILLVDDVESQADIHATLLAMDHVRYDKAHSAKSAWSKLKKKRYDLLLCDLRMPQVDGNKLIQKIVTVPQLEHMKIIAITEDDSIKKSDLPDEVDDLFYKPVNPSDVKNRISQLISH